MYIMFGSTSLNLVSYIFEEGNVPISVLRIEVMYQGWIQELAKRRGTNRPSVARWLENRAKLLK